jgi:hypothetical protein
MRRLPLVLLAAAAIACGGSDSTTGPVITLAPTDANVVGSFHLVAANGTLLPIVAVSSATQLATLTADTLALASDNTWTEVSVFNVLSLVDNTQGPVRTLSGGTYAIGSSRINFVTTQGGTSTFIGSVINNTLSLSFNGNLFVYNR